MIVVGICHREEFGQRDEELSPQCDGPKMADFLVHDLKPFIDYTICRDRVLHGRDYTGVLGFSLGASLALYQSGRALAWLRGHDYLSPALVQELAPDVLRHRIGLTYEAEAEEITPDKIVAQVVERTPVPAK